MATIRWPIKVLPARNVQFDIASRSLSGPASISGAVQVVSSDAGIWKATLDGIIVTGRESILAWRGVANLLEGRLGKIVVPLCKGYQPFLPEWGGLYTAVPHSDDAFFSDGAGYVSQVIDVTLAGSVAARAVSANVNIGVADMLQPGQHFSIGERLYRLRTVTYTSDTTAAITFRPPLREAASLGDRLNFDDPVCRMRLASDSEMDLPLELNRTARPTVSFVEDV
ncbi:MAG: hypothetical protein IBJ07_08850 [Rhizobiaceae bacterium]|nr:hypothetical protein [Rhizobiaceae bacterium]